PRARTRRRDPRERARRSRSASVATCRRRRSGAPARIRSCETDRGGAPVAAVFQLATLLLCVFVCVPGDAGSVESPRPAQTPGKIGECKKCHGAGLLPCSEHPKGECEYEDRVLF